MNERLFADAEAPLEIIRDGLSRRPLVATPDLQLMQWFREAGPGAASHTHDRGQVTFVISGRYRVRVGGHERVLGPGDSFAVLGGSNHSMDCLESGTYVTAKAATPHRPASTPVHAHEDSSLETHTH